MQSSPRQGYIEMPSNSTSPDRAQGLKISYQKMPGLMEPVLRSQTGDIVLGIDWIEQLDIKQGQCQGKKRVVEVGNHIKQQPSKSLILTISFDSFGISDPMSYLEENSSKLNETLKILKVINEKKKLGEIRKMQGDGTPLGNIKYLKLFKFSAINWPKLAFDDQIRAVREYALAESLFLNLEGTYISENILESIQKILKNNTGEYLQIEINLSNCPNANSAMLKKLMGTDSQSAPKVLKLRFMNWGKDPKKYFAGIPEQRHQIEKEYTKKDIELVRQKFKGGRNQVTFDFRGWDKSFNLKAIEEENNKEKENIQSMGVFSKNTNKDRQYNIVFMA